MRSPRPWPVWQLVWGPCSSAQWGRPVPEWRTWDGCTKCTNALSSIEIATPSGWAVYSQLCKSFFSDFLKCGIGGPAYSCPAVDEHLWCLFRILLTDRRRVQRLRDPSDGWCSLSFCHSKVVHGKDLTPPGQTEIDAVIMIWSPSSWSWLTILTCSLAWRLLWYFLYCRPTVGAPDRQCHWLFYYRLHNWT